MLVGPGQETASTAATWRRVGPLVVATALMLLAAVLVGCGSNGDDETTTSANTEAIEAGKAELDKASKIRTHVDASDVVKSFPPQIVTDGDVDAEKEGTPERALLEWWQAFQFSDYTAVEDLTGASTLKAVGKENLTEVVQTLGLQGIEVLGATENGNSASVNAALLTFSAEQTGEVPDKPTNSTPTTFAMVKENGDWLFDETEFVQLKVDALSRSGK